MPVFKGFEKADDTLVAVVDFPEATRHKRYWGEDGSIQNRLTPFPHEERLNEAAFRTKFAGLDFKAMSSLPFKEEGHDMDQLLQKQQAAIEASVPNLGIRSKPPSGTGM
jgi:hypothetical protein